MTIQPGHRPAATPAGPSETAAAAQAFLAEVESIMADCPRPTAVRIQDATIPSWQEGARIGTTPPVPQPGIPPQSRAAVDYAVRVLSTGVATSLISGSLALIIYASQWANPLVCGIVFTAPIGLAIPIAALSRLLNRAKEVVEAAPPEIHQHYSGPVHQDNRQQHLHNRTAGVIAYTRNQPQLPPAN